MKEKFIQIFTKPTKKQLIVLMSLLVICDVLLIAVMSEFFSESPFKGRYTLLWIMIASSFASMYGYYKKYKVAKS
jgi:membrane protein CcdC involved in cytochrome C biogenesis